MSLHFDSLQQRVLGTLIEKQLTVPETYPLTLNALVTGCNQKNNRDPITTAEDFDVEGALRALMDGGWVTRRERDGGRTLRYAHELTSQLGVEAADLALLAELLLRGPQAPGALKTRASRMAAVGEVAAVEARLQALASRAVPYVARLPRRHREAQARWTHLLDGRTPDEAVAAWRLGGGADDDTPAAASAASAASAPAPRAEPRTAPDDALDERLARLEARIEELLEHIERLEGR